MKALRIIRNQDGIALLVALTVITVLVALTLALHQKLDSALEASVADRHRVSMTQMANSGIQLAMAMLVKDKLESQVDSVQEDWANPDKIAEAMSAIVFDTGSVSVVISDERSRIQVNALVALPGHDFNPIQFQVWNRLFGVLIKQYEPLKDLDYMVLINSLKDWIDSGDDDAITGLSGAESSYYMDLDPAYECRNAPLNHLGDLARIKGFPPELFVAGDNFPQISDILTVQGMVPAAKGGYTFDGKINIDTAGVMVLSAILPEEYAIHAQDIVDYRVETVGDQYANNLSSDTWYKNVPGLEDLNLDPELITTKSDLFRITATATLDTDVLTIVAVVQRETIEKTGKWHCKILYWETK